MGGAQKLRILRNSANCYGISRIAISEFSTAYPYLTVETPDWRILENFVKF
jgi:hypothetical protein